jgi:hypothetical protein
VLLTHGPSRSPTFCTPSKSPAVFHSHCGSIHIRCMGSHLCAHVCTCSMGFHRCTHTAMLPTHPHTHPAPSTTSLPAICSATGYTLYGLAGSQLSDSTIPLTLTTGQTTTVGAFLTTYFGFQFSEWVGDSGSRWTCRVCGIGHICG